MTDEDSGTSIDRNPPEEPLTMDAVLTQISHETRARIVLELGGYSDGPTDFEGLGFTELMDRVGAEDSGRFNYHLDELVGGLVEKADGEYWLRVTGHLIYQALVAGTLTDDVETPTFSLPDRCEDCDGSLSADYAADQILTVDCEECGRTHQHLEFPARGVVGRSGEETLTAAARYFNGQFASLRRGVCPRCAGRVRRELRPASETPILAELRPGVEGFALTGCRACSLERIASPATIALTTPRAVAFFDARGRDAYDVPPYRVGEYVVQMAMYDDPPVSASVTFDVGTDRLTVRLDDSLSVIETTEG